MTEAKKYVTYTPAVDIMEQGAGWTLLMDIPGVDQKTLDIDVEDKVLKVTGESDLTEKAMAVKYERSFTLSDEVDTTSIKATLRNGVLELALPKAESAKPQKIKVLSA